MSAALEMRQDPGKAASAVLAALVHIALAVLLIYGIRWQTRPPEVFEVELVRAAPAPPAPVAEAVPPPVPLPKAEPKAEPKPEPKPVPPAKPDIALKEKPKPEPKPKPESKVEPKPKPQSKVEPKPEPDKASQKLMEEALKREAERLAQRRAIESEERRIAESKAALAAAARSKAKSDYEGKIRGKIKGNIVLPPDIKGNPEAIFDVVQLPSGEILSVKLKKSSGHAAYDGAVERAILKSSPLPKPEQGDLFSRNLELKFRPLEE